MRYLDKFGLFDSGELNKSGFYWLVATLLQKAERQHDSMETTCRAQNCLILRKVRR